MSFVEFMWAIRVGHSGITSSCIRYSEAIYWKYKKIMFSGDWFCCWCDRHRLAALYWLYGELKTRSTLDSNKSLISFSRFDSVIVYYLRSKSKARIAMVKMLKNMLVIEAKDKQYLLKRITRETKGKGKFQRRHLHTSRSNLCLYSSTDWLFEEVNKNNNTIPRRLNGGLESYAEFYYEKRRNGELDSSTSSNSKWMSSNWTALSETMNSFHSSRHRFIDEIWHVATAT